MEQRKKKTLAIDKRFQEKFWGNPERVIEDIVYELHLFFWIYRRRRWHPMYRQIKNATRVFQSVGTSWRAHLETKSGLTKVRIKSRTTILKRARRLFSGESFYNSWLDQNPRLSYYVAHQKLRAFHDVFGLSNDQMRKYKERRVRRGDHRGEAREGIDRVRKALLSNSYRMTEEELAHYTKIDPVPLQAILKLMRRLGRIATATQVKGADRVSVIVLKDPRKD